MNPYERRIIHSALQNDKYVETYSEGEEPFRKVVISIKRVVVITDIVIGIIAEIIKKITTSIKLVKKRIIL